MKLSMIVKLKIGFGIMPHASNGRIILAMLKKIPVDIMTRDRYLRPCNSERYDISTANGPHILENYQMSHESKRKS